MKKKHIVSLLVCVTLCVTQIKASANTEFDTLYSKINADTSTPRSFTATGNMNATSNLGTQAGANSNLTLDGAGFTLDGANGATRYSHLTVSTGRTLTLQNFGSLNADGTVKTAVQNFLTPSTGYIKRGGVLYNNGTVYIKNSVFLNNEGEGLLVTGGAIYNARNLDISDSTFVGNHAIASEGASGGVVQNDRTMAITNSTFTGNSSTSSGDNASAAGGAIENELECIITGSSFKNNTATTTGTGSWAEGGAIYNASKCIITGSTFDSNSTTSLDAADGGAIFNNGEMTITGSTFKNNTVTTTATYSYAAGGAVFNVAKCIITDSTFDSNSTTSTYTAYGGAISNYGEMTITGSTLKNNTVTTTAADSFACGGAIYNNTNNITESIITGSTFDNNSATSTYCAYGGAIENKSGTITISSSSIFKNNTVTTTGTDSYACGGAIYNEAGIVTISSGSIFKNTASGFNALGGAIFNTGEMTITGSTFENNTASATGVGSSAYGGAIYNGNATATITNSIFSGNTATTAGGAIFNCDNATLNIIADNGTTSFTSNTANGISNAIHLESGAMNLNAGNGGVITFNDKITSGNINNVINVNKIGSATVGDPPITAPTDGVVKFNETASNATVKLYGGTMMLGNDNYLNGNNVSLNGGTLNMINSAVGVANFNNLALNGTTNLNIDADLAHSAVDRITSINPITGSGTLNISQVRVISDAAAANTSINFINSALGGQVTMTATEALTPICKYGMTYDSTSGNLNFARTAFNPAVLGTPVASAAGVYTNQSTVYSEALGRMDAIMLLPETDRLLMLYRNKTASADGQMVFSPTFLPEEKAGIWVKQYTSFENVPLNNGPNVSSVGYGLLIGGDTPFKQLKHGFMGYLTAYGGYNGSHQNYDQVGVYQSGGVLGLTGTVYKGKFFSALTANAGASAGNSYNMYGTDNFTTLIAGIASKSGYNFEFASGKVILQPSFMMSYTFANTFDYTTASGVNITSNPLNALQLMPGVKLIGNLKNGWQPYLGLSMVFNIMDSQKFYANDVQLPQMSVNPYVEYGIGLQRKWGERFTGFAQAMARGGGRNGIAMQFGFRWAI